MGHIFRYLGTGEAIVAGGLNGIHLARGRWPDIKVLVTSGFPETKFYGNGNGNGRGAQTLPWRLLNKPYRKEDLARALREALGE